MTDKEKIEMLERENKMLREQIVLYEALKKVEEEVDKKVKEEIIKEYIPYPVYPNYPIYPTITYTDKTIPTKHTEITC